MADGKEKPRTTANRRIGKPNSSASRFKTKLAVLAGGITLSVSWGTIASLNVITDPADQLAVLRKAARNGQLYPVASPEDGKSLRSAQWSNADWKNWRNNTPG
jgi:hypothetical protein